MQYSINFGEVKDRVDVTGLGFQRMCGALPLGERTGRFMGARAKYTDEPLGDPKVVADFLPSHRDMAFRRKGLAGELLESVKQMKAGKTQVVLSPAVVARKRIGLSQSEFAKVLGVSVRTLQDWERGREQPRGAARTLLKIAQTNPRALLAVAGK